MERKDFYRSIHHLFTTDNGKKVLDQLIKDYIHNSEIGDDAYRTYYNLGQSDIIRLFMRIAETDPDRIGISYDYTEDK